jgi:glyoxylase-like metal-dependent hydrolase (beta-lactamase superfamily II)
MTTTDMGDADQVPAWVRWQARPFPDANLLLLPGPHPALIDTGFVGNAARTRDWAEAEAGTRIELVVNTHWHADHVGGNAALQAAGAAIATGAPDADAVRRRDPGCCVAEYLDQPVAPYTVDRALDDGEILTLGQTQWEVVRTPGHTPGHLCLWQPDERLLIAGDALSDYDVGWVCTALDGPDAAATAVTSLERIAELRPRVILPAHGPRPADPAAAMAKAHRRARRLVDDPDGAVWYGARRIFAFALMIRGGLPMDTVEDYLLDRAWFTDAARLLRRPTADLAIELVESMRRSGAVVEQDRRLHAAAEHTPVPPAALNQPWPRAWPPEIRTEGAATR